MELVALRVIITILATLTALIFISLVYLFPEISVFLLTIEVLLLPTVYIVGNYIAEHLMEKRHNMTIGYISSQTDSLQEKYNKARLLNVKLEEEVRYLRKYGK